MQVSGVLTVPECQAFIDAAESLGFQHQGSGGPAAGEAFRDNERVSVQVGPTACMPAVAVIMLLKEAAA
jgi:hypothetical protein